MQPAGRGVRACSPQSRGVRAARKVGACVRAARTRREELLAHEATRLEERRHQPKVGTEAREGALGEEALRLRPELERVRRAQRAHLCGAPLRVGVARVGLAAHEHLAVLQLAAAKEQRRQHVEQQVHALVRVRARVRVRVGVSG